jgi:hypothetical protein
MSMAFDRPVFRRFGIVRNTNNRLAKASESMIVAFDRQAITLAAYSQERTFGSLSQDGTGSHQHFDLVSVNLEEMRKVS